MRSSTLFILVASVTSCSRKKESMNGHKTRDIKQCLGFDQSIFGRLKSPNRIMFGNGGVSSNIQLNILLTIVSKSELVQEGRVYKEEL